MQLPELLKRQAAKRLDSFCAQEAERLLHPRQLNYRIEGQQVNLFEIRQCSFNRQRQQIPIAQLRYSPQLNQWTLHHQNGEHWQLYLNVNPSLDLNKLLTAIQQDPMGYFSPE
jgi:Protein of unknown function (DUF3024)